MNLVTNKQMNHGVNDTVTHVLRWCTNSLRASKNHAIDCIGSLSKNSHGYLRFHSTMKETKWDNLYFKLSRQSSLSPPKYANAQRICGTWTK